MRRKISGGGGVICKRWTWKLIKGSILLKPSAVRPLWRRARGPSGLLPEVWLLRFKFHSLKIHRFCSSRAQLLHCVVLCLIISNQISSKVKKKKSLAKIFFFSICWLNSPVSWEERYGLLDSPHLYSWTLWNSVSHLFNVIFFCKMNEVILKW